MIYKAYCAGLDIRRTDFWVACSTKTSGLYSVIGSGLHWAEGLAFKGSGLRLICSGPGANKSNLNCKPQTRQPAEP